MKRRAFLAGAVACLPAAAFATVAPSYESTKNQGVRLTSSDPPEPGFEYIRGRRYQVVLNDQVVERAVRVDSFEGRVWRHRTGPSGRLLLHGNEVAVEELRGQVDVYELVFESGDAQPHRGRKVG